MKAKEMPYIIKGETFQDYRGIITSNNTLDLSQVKRFYQIENVHCHFNRGWKGHTIEKRWFIASLGKVEIKVVDIESLKKSEYSNIKRYNLSSDNLNSLYVPPGYATAIKQLIEKSRVMVFSDFLLNESNDEIQFDYTEQ